MQEAVVNETKKETAKIVKIEGKVDEPMRILDLDRFKRMNNVQIKVFWYMSDELMPVRISEELVLLLLFDG